MKTNPFRQYGGAKSISESLNHSSRVGLNHSSSDPNLVVIGPI